MCIAFMCIHSYSCIEVAPHMQETEYYVRVQDICSIVHQEYAEGTAAQCHSHCQYRSLHGTLHQ